MLVLIQCYEHQAALGPVRPMHIISFENDLDSLRLAFANNEKFTYLRHSGPSWILKEGRWQSKDHAGLSWELIPGDFLESMSQASRPPDIIFYDLFSSKTHSTAWTLEAFRRLFAACAGRSAELFTYTVATSARVASARSWLLYRKGPQRRRKNRDHHCPHARRRRRTGT